MRVLPTGTTSTARAGGRRPTRRCAYALGHHQRRRGGAGPAVRAVPVPRARRAARHRRRHRGGPAGGGHPVRLRPLRAGVRGPGGQRHHLPGPVGGAGHGQGARATPPASWTPGPSRSTRWGPVVGHRRPGRPRHPAGGAGPGPARSSTSPAISASTRAAWCSATGRWSRCARWSGPAWRTAASCSGTRTTAPRSGLVKFDLLGLGMLTALHYAVDLIRDAHGVEVDLADIPQEDEVYEMLCRADSVGVFQVESRAQMATLPRLKPRHVLRPGGRGGPHPARAHPGRLGAPLHPPAQRPGAGHLPAPAARAQPGQDPRGAAVPGAADADGHRRGRLHRRPRPTSCARPWAPSAAGSGWSSCGPGSTPAWPSGASPVTVADEIFDKLAAFANFGFPESHSVSLRLPRVLLARGSSCTTRRPSAPRCSTPSPWGSGRRRRWWPTPAATAWRCAPPTSTGPVTWRDPSSSPGARGRSSACRRAQRGRRPGRAHRGRDATPAGPTATWRTCAAGADAPRTCSRPWPRPGPSAASPIRRGGPGSAPGAVGGGGGGPDRPDRLAGMVTGVHAPRCPA